MRLINADQMADGEEGQFPYNIQYCDDCDIYKWVEDQPTVDAELVVYAHWIPRGMKNKWGRVYTCSHCGYPTWMFFDNLRDARRCQFCGAKMIEKE